jgi:GNAT superfamily N-acetyltransferase
VSSTLSNNPVSDWTVRPATPADLPAIVALSDGLFQEDSGQRDPLMNHGWARTHGLRYFGDLLANPAYIVLVASSEHTVIGFLAGSRREADALRPVISAELESMFVAPGWRGRGVGQGLAERFLAWAREHGAVWVTVTAYATNTGALAFYQRLGFARHTVTLGQRLTVEA